MSDEVKNSMTFIINWGAKIVFGILAFLCARTFIEIQTNTEKMAEGIQQLNKSMIRVETRMDNHDKEIDRLDRTKADRR